MTQNIRYYKGKYKVKVVTESEGYWTIEALEDFSDVLDGEKVVVKAGEQRIVPPSEVYKHEGLPPMVQEHTYELRMEKKVKRLVEESENSEKSS